MIIPFIFYAPGESLECLKSSKPMPKTCNSFKEISVTRSSLRSIIEKFDRNFDQPQKY